MKTPEELLARVLNHLSEKFKNKLILKGGMLLRLYNSPRATQDIDFVFISDQSKKDLKARFLKSLQDMEGIEVERVEVNSRGIFIDVQSAQLPPQRCLIEINVLPEVKLPPEPLSTSVLSQKHALETHVVSTMSFPEAFAHKIAATLERETTRDLYDLSQMEAMGNFDQQTLEERLSKLSIKRGKPQSLTFKDAAQLLKKRLEALSPKKIEEELHPLLPSEHHPGLLRIIKASVGRLIQRLEGLT